MVTLCDFERGAVAVSALLAEEKEHVLLDLACGKHVPLTASFLIFRSSVNLLTALCSGADTAGNPSKLLISRSAASLCTARKRKKKTMPSLRSSAPSDNKPELPVAKPTTLTHSNVTVDAVSNQLFPQPILSLTDADSSGTLAVTAPNGVETAAAADESAMPPPATVLFSSASACTHAAPHAHTHASSVRVTPDVHRVSHLMRGDCVTERSTDSSVRHDFANSMISNVSNLLDNLDSLRFSPARTRQPQLSSAPPRSTSPRRANTRTPAACRSAVRSPCANANARQPVASTPDFLQNPELTRTEGGDALAVQLSSANSQSSPFSSLNTGRNVHRSPVAAAETSVMITTDAMLTHQCSSSRPPLRSADLSGVPRPAVLLSPLDDVSSSEGTRARASTCAHAHSVARLVSPTHTPGAAIQRARPLLDLRRDQHSAATVAITITTTTEEAEVEAEAELSPISLSSEASESIVPVRMPRRWSSVPDTLLVLPTLAGEMSPLTLTLTVRSADCAAPHDHFSSGFIVGGSPTVECTCARGLSPIVTTTVDDCTCAAVEMSSPSFFFGSLSPIRPQSTTFSSTPPLSLPLPLPPPLPLPLPLPPPLPLPLPLPLPPALPLPLPLPLPLLTTPHRTTPHLTAPPLSIPNHTTSASAGSRAALHIETCIYCRNGQPHGFTFSTAGRQQA